MEQDFHYYTIYRLAALAGFSRSDAQTIAYASQYVDNSTESEPIRPFEDQYFDTARTAHYNLEGFTWNVQKKIYMPFHFLPSMIRWRSPAKFFYITQPATGDKTELATLLVDDALTEPNKRFRLIRTGVALHAVADTFSHFGFSGRQHDENNVGTIWFKEKDKWDARFFETHADLFVPRIGHLEAFKFPDQPWLLWRYEDNNGNPIPRNNTNWCLKGAALIYQFLAAAKTRSPAGQPKNLSRDFPEDYQTMADLFSQKGSLEKRCTRWKDYTQAQDYDKQTWRKQAVKGNVDWDDMSRSKFGNHAVRLTGKKGFETSKWTFFHRAAFKQRSLVLGWLN
ncbi:MAG: hypothetical protein HF978_10455 [Desulfobacteraceae bacterium]|nr:hypothetical protein [Desulfobacteraceae bacterium]MBC2755955.1 hypothetical protein [Desulfobacteraceae bacterium]